MNQLAELLLNLIKKEDLDTRKEEWDSLFLIVDFNRMKEEYPNMWNKEYKMLPLAGTWSEIKKKFTEYCQRVNGQVENLINSYLPYFNSEIKPILQKPEGDKTLLFRCKRLLENKVIGESSSLFLDLVIWEVEYRQVEKFKELLTNLNTQPMFLTDREDELFANDCEKMIEGRINYLLSQRFFLKWSQLIAKSGIQQEEWVELGNYLKMWAQGKGASSEWAEDLKAMEKARDDLFVLGSESISDGLPFLQLGYIKEDTELGLKVVLQNKKGFNLNNPYLWVVHLHQKVVRPYVVRGFRMVNPKSLYVEVKLEEEWVWRDYGVIMNGAGSLVSGNHMVYQERNWGNNKLSHLHYPFCGDLGDKKVHDIPWPEKINLALFTVRQTPDLGHAGSFNETDWTKDISIPGLYTIEKITNFDTLKSLFKQKEYQTFLAPSDYSTGEIFYVRQKTLSIPIPEVIYKHPHLPTHSTFQFYFLNNSLFTANLAYLKIRDKQIKIDWKIKANPSGTYVSFRSEHILFKWKIEVRQGIVNMSLVKVAIEGASKFAGAVAKAVGGFFGIDTSGADEAKKDMAQNLIGRDRGKDFMERERSQRNQEQQTARMFQSTLQYTGDNPVEPSVFYSNTVSFPYNLFDFWLRTEKEPFTCRIYQSDNLLNNLIHNNNQNPTTYPLNITFAKLGNILRAGFIQGRLDSDHDPNNKMFEYFARGVTFYKDKKEHFVNPNLGVSQTINQVQYSSAGYSHGYTAQAITEGGDGISVDIPYTADQRGYGHTTFFKLTDPGEMDRLHQVITSSIGSLPRNHYDNHNGFCWGCTYDDLNDKGFMSIKFTPQADCSTILKLDVNSSGTRDLELKAGVEYEVTISETQFIFKSEGRTRLVIQEVPGYDDFNADDFRPIAGTGTEIEIPLQDPEIALPEPGEGDPTPEDNIPPPDPFDPTGGEPEIPPIEPDLPPDISPEPDQDPPPDIPPPEPEIPEPEAPEGDPGRDPEGDRGDGDPPPPDAPDDDPDRD